jgi:hypothetical protein
MPSDQNMLRVWENQPTEHAQISLDQLRQRTRQLQKKVFRRNLREDAAAVIVVVMFTYYIRLAPTLVIRIGECLIIAATIFVIWTLHRCGSSRTVPAELTLRTCVDFHRRELERQRDLLRGVWTWYLLPFVPGLAISLIGGFLQKLHLPHASEEMHAIRIRFICVAAICALVFFAIGMLNRRAANKLQREIELLDGVNSES